MRREEHFQHYGEILESGDRFDVVDCVRCGFAHISPLPRPDDLRKVYAEEYYSVDKPAYAEGIARDLDWWRLAFSDRYDEFESHLEPGRRRLLDIGCGPGFFLQYGVERGWHVEGVEPSRQAVEYARGLGLKVFEGFFDTDTVQQFGTFDVVHMNNVLEHVPNPEEILTSAHKLLPPEGLICVTVPNDFNPFQRALRAACDFAPWWVAAPHHVNYFTFDSLSDLLERCGYRICCREATFPIDLFLLMGENYVGNDAVGRSCHMRRMTFENNLDRAGMNELKRRLYRALAAEGLGREIVLIGVSKG